MRASEGTKLISWMHSIHESKWWLDPIEILCVGAGELYQFEALVVASSVLAATAAHACGRPTESANAGELCFAMGALIDAGARHFTAGQGKIVAPRLVVEAEFGTR